MPEMDLFEGDVAFLHRVYNAPFRTLKRGWFGWRGTWAYKVKQLIEVGYLRMSYDWKLDAPKVTLTEKGEARLLRELNANTQSLTCD